MTRRSLKNVRGRVRARGDAKVADVLAGAWRRAASEEPDGLTHGFHSWPARMHPAIAREVLAAFDGRVVLDPFCGGGTVLVEARVAGRRGVGVDLNPLAVRVADVRCDARPAPSRAAFVATARAVAAASEARVRGRVPIQVKLPREEIAFYAPHVLKELGGLRAEISEVADDRDRRALAMVLSAILVKVSKQRADTSRDAQERRIRKGLSTELFLRKAEELSGRWAELASRAKAPPPLLIEGDARRLPRLMRARRADLIVTSPPYGGTYDYAEHHARRIAFLELDDRKLRRFELGARRDLSRSPAGSGRWDRQVDAMLEAMVAVLQPRGRIVLVMGDAQVGADRVEVPSQLARLAPARGLRIEAVASQERPDWRGGRAREEHVVSLVRA